MVRTRRTAVVLLATLACLVGTAEAQFGGLGRIAKSVGIGAAPIPKGLLGQEPVATALTDAQWGDPSKDGFEPPMAKRRLTELKRSPGGGFVLQAGYFEFHDQSYCLHAGTHGPGGGEGYLYAPVLGSAHDAVQTIARNSVAHPEIDQHLVQTLLWAIVARAKFEDLSNEHKAVAQKLLTPRQLVTLNRSALDALTSGPIAGHLPGPLQQIANAEASMRQLLASPGTSYADLERVAVLTGRTPPGPGSQPISKGRWSLHPDGYWIRYLPVNYTNTVVDIWVAPDSAGVGKTYDPATHIAVPGDTGRQRLLQSGRAYTG